MEEAEASLTGLCLVHPSLSLVLLSSTPDVDSTLILLLFLEKQQHGKVLSESLVETAAHDWADLGNACEMGKEIHAEKWKLLGDLTISPLSLKITLSKSS